MTGHQFVLVLHLFCTATGIGLSLSNLVNLRLTGQAAADCAKGLALQRTTIARLGDVVITLIWLTGGLALWQRGGMAGLGTAFHAKLAFVVLLTLAHGLARYTAGVIRRTGQIALMRRLTLAAGMVWLSAVMALIMAVISLSP